ncbi:MAG: MobQ family relaxase [Thiolinea sp.]
MAIYHCTTKPLSRSAGRSAVAAAAYRSGQSLKDERTDTQHDYTKKSGIMQSYTLLPSGESCDRAELWNAAEAAEKRKDSRTAREWIIAIPDELVSKTKIDQLWHGNPDQKLVKEFANHLSKTYGVAVDVAIHAPDKKGDQRNYHAHILTTTRTAKIENGKIALGGKATIELSDKKRGELQLGKAKEDVKKIREVWADLANKMLEQQGKESRIDHRSLKDQGIDQIPQIHVGVTATSMERKGKTTERGSHNNKIKKLNTEMTDLQKRRERWLEVQEWEKARQQKDDEQKHQEQKQRQERQKQQRKAERLKAQQEQQRQLEKLSPENIEKTFNTLLESAEKTIEQHFEKLETEKEKANAIHSTHLRAKPEPPTGLFAGFKRKQFETEKADWEHKEKTLRSKWLQTSRRWEDRQRDNNAHQMANKALKEQHPEMHKERERLKQLEQEKAKQEREAKRKERELARQQRNRSRGRGGIEL